MEYIDISICCKTLLAYFDEDFMYGHEEMCVQNFISYIKKNEDVELKYDNDKILVPEVCSQDKFIYEYLKKTEEDFSAKDCAYIALHRLGVPPIEAMSLGSLEKTVRGLIKDKAYIKRINGRVNTLCVDKDTARNISSHPDLVVLIEKQIKKAEISHENSTAWRAYEFEKKKIAYLDYLSDSDNDDNYTRYLLSDDEKNNLMVKAIYGLFFTDFDFEKYESYYEEMMLLADAWDFGERYQELYDIFSKPNYKYEFYQNTKQDELFEALTDKIAEKILRKIEKN